MTEEDWFKFVAMGDPKIVSVARLPMELCKYVKCSSTLIQMEHTYALKSAQKHRLRAAHFPMLPIVIDCGLVIQDRPRHLSFFFFEDVVFGGWLQATIKANEAGTENWVATFHPASAKEVKRMTKNHRVIRDEKI